jgi:glycosyltransferase involved in cell wall biosynthesis
MAHAKAVDISAIICTYQNPTLLEGAIRTLLDQTLSADRYEIVVVDNNSQDDTPNVVRMIADRSYTTVRYILETRRGLSYARNSGVEASRGEIVAFLDDDAEADKHWLSVLLQAYDGNPDIWAVGGKILPIWHTTDRPEWWRDEFLGWLSLVDWGDEPKPLVWPERILGTNCSFRKSIFSEVGHFDPRLGRRGRSLLGHEETEVQQRIHLSNKIVHYEPNAIVHHHVPPERLTDDYFFRRQFGASRSGMALMVKQQGGLRALRPVLIDVLLIARRVLMIARTVRRSSAQASFNHKRMLWHYWGHVVGFAENLLDLGTR